MAIEPNPIYKGLVASFQDLIDGINQREDTLSLEEKQRTIIQLTEAAHTLDALNQEQAAALRTIEQLDIQNMIGTSERLLALQKHLNDVVVENFNKKLEIIQLSGSRYEEALLSKIDAIQEEVNLVRQQNRLLRKENIRLSYSAPTSSLPKVLIGHQAPVTALLSLESTHFVSSSLDKTIRLWSQTGCPSHKIIAEAEVYSLTVLNESAFASGCGIGSPGYENFAIKLWDTEGLYRGSLRGHKGSILALASISSTLLVSGSADKSVRLWDLREKKEIEIFEGHTAPIRALAVGYNETLISGSEDCTIKFWNRNKVNVTKVSKAGSSVYCFTQLQDRTLVSGCGGMIKLWDEEGLSKNFFITEEDNLCALTTLPNGSLAGCFNDKSYIKIWSPHQGILKQELAGGSHFRSLATLENGTLAGGTEEGPIKLWEATRKN